MAVAHTTDAHDPEAMGKVIRSLATLRGCTAKDVAAHLGLSQGQLSKRMSGEVPFKAQELRAIGVYLEVPPGLFYLSVDEVFARLSASAYKRDKLRGLPSPRKPRLSPPRAPLVSTVSDG